jgi:hypothetical protein
MIDLEIAKTLQKRLDEALKKQTRKEIYEGDIIQRSTFSKIPYKVPLVCEWSNEEASYILKDTNGSEYVYLSDFIESLEVVGNVCEQ